MHVFLQIGSLRSCAFCRLWLRRQLWTAQIGSCECAKHSAYMTSPGHFTPALLSFWVTYSSLTIAVSRIHQTMQEGLKIVSIIITAWICQRVSHNKLTWKILEGSSWSTVTSAASYVCALSWQFLAHNLGVYHIIFIELLGNENRHKTFNEAK